MRIIGGIYKGRKLLPMEGRDIRPTTDRARESLFNILGDRIFQARVLDLFSGTGAVGMEALSRNASFVMFADKSRTSCKIIGQNLEQCKNHLPLETHAKVVCTDILSPNFVSALPKDPFDLIFLDPPYQKSMIDQLLTDGNLASCLSSKGMLIAEHSPKEALQPAYPGLDFFRQKKYGNTAFSFFLLSSSLLQGDSHEP